MTILIQFPELPKLIKRSGLSFETSNPWMLHALLNASLLEALDERELLWEIRKSFNSALAQLKSDEGLLPLASLYQLPFAPATAKEFSLLFQLIHLAVDAEEGEVNGKKLTAIYELAMEALRFNWDYDIPFESYIEEFKAYFLLIKTFAESKSTIDPHSLKDFELAQEKMQKREQQLRQDVRYAKTFERDNFR